MKVYPVNAMEAAALNSMQIESYARINDLHNRYLNYQVDFTANNITITGIWDELIDVDSFIIANTNGQYMRLELKNGEDIEYTIETELTEEINIIEILEDDVLTTKQIDNFSLTVQGEEGISIGYLYIGLAWKLPRFAVNPTDTNNLRSEVNRTMSGQVTGVPVDTLRSFSAEFIRVENQDKKLIDDYLNGVQTVVPHVIDPYYEAHEEFKPMFCTIEKAGDKEKRDEDGFFWDFSISWLEAK